MIKNILTASGLPYRQGWFPSMPAESCVVYTDDVEVDGPDRVAPATAAGLPCIYHHDVRLELYAIQADPAAEAALEAQIVATGLTFVRYDREWLRDVKRYVTVYELTYTTKT